MHRTVCALSGLMLLMALVFSGCAADRTRNQDGDLHFPADAEVANRPPDAAIQPDAEPPPPDCDRSQAWFEEVGEWPLPPPAHLAEQPPEALEGIPWVHDLRVVGEHAYVMHSEGLHIIDVSNPEAPALMGQVGTGGAMARGVDVVQQGDRTLALVAVIGDGLRVMDVSDVRNPVEVGAFDLVGAAGAEYARRVQVVGDLAYVAALSQGLWLVDISTPERPRPVGHLTAGADHPTTGTADVVVVEDRAYVVDTRGEMSILDVGDPRSIEPLGHLPLPEADGGVAIQVRDGVAYVAQETRATLTRIDVSDARAPAVIRPDLVYGDPNDDQATAPRGLAFDAEGLLYVVGEQPTMRTFDLEVSPPSDLTPSITGAAQAVEVHLPWAFVATDHSLKVLQQICPENP